MPDPETAEGPSISVVIPLYNEAASVGSLIDEIRAALTGSYGRYEIILVDDGSLDSTLATITELAASDNRIKVIGFARNYGQTAALAAGFDHAKAEIVVALDGDGQNDPADIPAMLARIADGYDAVYGWRRDRRDAVLSRRLPSRLANLLISTVTGVKVRDFGCTLKVYRRSVLERFRLYGEMHRFIPLYVHWLGGKACEMEVAHRPRRRGRSSYGFGRVPKVLLDLLVVLFLHRYLAKPIYVFGGFALICFVAAFGFAVWAVYLKLFEGASFILTPLPLLTVTTGLMGMISLLMGLLAEVVVRTYHESLDKRIYVIRSMENLG